MAIVKMDKFNLLSFDSDREKLLDTLQSFNYVHFNDLILDDDKSYLSELKNNEKLAQIDQQINQVDYVISLIRDYNKDSKDKLDNKVTDLSLEELNKRGYNFGFDLIYDKLRELVSNREKLVGKRDNLTNTYNELSPWKEK